MPDGRPVAFVGNVTRAPELRFSGAGKAFAKFGIAYTPYTPRDQPDAETTFYDVVCFGSLGENVAESIQRGDRVAVIGKRHDNTWTGNDGQERTTKEVIADALGPDLRFTTAQLVRERRETSKAAPKASAYADDEERFD